MLFQTDSFPIITIKPQFKFTTLSLLHPLIQTFIELKTLITKKLERKFDAEWIMFRQMIAVLV